MGLRELPRAWLAAGGPDAVERPCKPTGRSAPRACLQCCIRTAWPNVAKQAVQSIKNLSTPPTACSHVKCVSASGAPVGLPECPACLCESFWMARLTGLSASCHEWVSRDCRFLTAFLKAGRMTVSGGQFDWALTSRGGESGAQRNSTGAGRLFEQAAPES